MKLGHAEQCSQDFLPWVLVLAVPACVSSNCAMGPMREPGGDAGGSDRRVEPTESTFTCR